jgi:hypothetical protein
LIAVFSLSRNRSCDTSTDRRCGGESSFCRSPHGQAPPICEVLQDARLIRPLCVPRMKRIACVATRLVLLRARNADRCARPRGCSELLAARSQTRQSLGFLPMHFNTCGASSVLGSRAPGV